MVADVRTIIPTYCVPLSEPVIHATAADISQIKRTVKLITEQKNMYVGDIHTIEESERNCTNILFQRQAFRGGGFSHEDLEY